MTNRPQGMSQLDYLWTHFGAYEVSNEASQVPSENIILTEQALANFLQETTSGGITKLTYRKHPTKEGIMQLIGTSANGSELTIVEMPEEVHVQSFQRRKITQEDIDNGFDYPIDSDILSIILTNGQELIVSMMDLDLMISSKDTSTIHTEIVNGIISSTLRIDSRNNDNSIIPIYNSGNGIYADIKVSKTDSGVEITKETDGLSACIPINGSKLRFKTLKLDQYLVLEPKDATTLYIITDVPYIYFGGVRYGSGLETSDSPIVSITYDADHMLFSYKKVGEDITQIHLGPADENTPGMMSTESYVDLQNLKNKLGDLDDIPEYIENQVGQLAYSLELGEQHNNIRPLILKAKNGGILSTVNLDVENFLQEAENKIADAQDVIDSGETVQEGHQILILTLTSGDKVYVDLNALVTAYTVGSTDTIELNLNNNNFTANLKINGNEKMIHSDSKGIQTYWSVVQDQNTVTFYGKDQTLEYKLGQIIVPDALQGYQFIGQITSDNVIQYPPRTVDGIDYDYESNPVIIGDPYIILTYGETTKYYDYISINPILQVIGISPKEYNAITKDDQGLLYSENRSIVSGELTDGILTIQLSNNTNIIIPIPEATKEQSGLLSSEDKSKLETIFGDGDESIYSMQEELDRLKSDVNNIGNVIIPEMNSNTAKALDRKVDWDETKTVIPLPKNGAISALRDEETLEGGNLIAQRTYDSGATYVTEVGTVKNKLTLNATERPQLDLPESIQEKLAYLSDLEAKQDKLTAGTGINIDESSTISSTIDLTPYLTKDDAANTYQPKGDYATLTEGKDIILPKNGSITMIQNEETGSGGVVICQRDYGDGNVTEVGNARNKLTFNATERPQIDLAGGSQEKMAYESDLIKYGMFYPGVKVDTQKLFALTKSSTESDIKAALQLETASGSYTLPTESILNDCLGKGYQLLSNWMPVNVAWNGAAWVFYLVGQTYMNQPNAVATVSIKITDGVYSVFQAAKVTKLASIDDLKLMPNVIRFPLRTLQDKVYTQEEILEWFEATEISELKQKIVRGGIYYLQYGISLSGNPMYYKMPVEYVAFESANQIKLVFNGLNTRDDVPSKYEILMNLDGTVIEGNSNVKLIITSLSTQPEEIQDQIQSNIVQELGQDTTKVISQKVVTDNISKINAAISEMIPLSQKGSVNGVASLDENGKVPSTQLPGFVDDVLEYDNFEAFPETGETGKIYVTKDTNLEYRWSGTQYTQISKSVGIGETSSTAYAGNKGKQVTDRVAEVYSANSVINGLSDITFDSDNTEAQTLSADNAVKTWDGSGTSHDMKIPYATTTKAGAMSATDKAKLDQLTEGLSDDTPSISEVVENINTITQNITDIQGDITNIENSIGDTSNLTTEATNLTDAINEHETQIDTISNDVFNLKNNTVKSVQVGANEVITPVEGLVTIPNATSEADGTMSKEDKTKLDILNKITFDYDQLIAAETTPNIELYDNIRKAYSSGLQPILVYDEGTQQHYYPCSISAYQGSSGSRIYYLEVNRSDIYAKDLETWNFSIISNGTVSYTDSKLDLSYLNTDGDGTQFLANDGTYKEIIIPESTLSDDYTASAESSEPAAGDTYETAISKLHKTILDLTSRIADLEQALTLKTV